MWLRTALREKSEIRNPKSENSTPTLGVWISIFGFRISDFGFCFCGLALWLAAAGAATAQEQTPHADANGWSPPPSIPRALSSRSKTPISERQAAETTGASSSAYVNPTTGATVPVPPPPPQIPADEWTPAAEVHQTSLLQPPKPGEPVKAPKEEEEVQIQLEPPGPDRIFGRRDSERSLMIRIQQEVRQQKRHPVDFPGEPILSTERYLARLFPPMTETVEPNYVCYGRLLFEDKNSERYGWDLGFIQPFVSGGIFFWDVAWLPYRLASEPCRHFECNSGYCLPGDPVPYLLYPPIYSVTGAGAEIGTIVFLSWIFPG
jgi:hypothetical protein